MKKQGFPILLILMMLITPIASAFEHCAGMDMPDHITDSHNSSFTPSADNSISSVHQKMLKESPSEQMDMDCHSSGSCSVHICGGYGITSSIPTLNAVGSSYQSNFEYNPPYSTVLPSELRPPIFIL